MPLYSAGSITPYPQSDVTPTYSHKLKKSDGEIDWAKPAAQIEREVRAFQGWPRSRAKIGPVECIITKAHVSKESGPAGKVRIESHSLGVYCASDLLVIDSLTPLGRKEMSATAFLNGYHIT